MGPGITVKVEVLGERQPLVPAWSVPWPPEEGDESEALTLRALITRIVAREVTAFDDRQKQLRFVRALTERQMDEALARGKVVSGGRGPMQKVDPDEAVANALQAFEDGLYLVIVDEREQRELDDQVFLKPDSHIIFLRLVFLAGG